MNIITALIARILPRKTVASTMATFNKAIAGLANKLRKLVEA